MFGRGFFLNYKFICQIEDYSNYLFHIVLLFFLILRDCSRSMFVRFMSIKLLIIFPHLLFDGCRIHNDILCFIPDTGYLELFSFYFCQSKWFFNFFKRVLIFSSSFAYFCSLFFLSPAFFDIFCFMLSSYLRQELRLLI